MEKQTQMRTPQFSISPEELSNLSIPKLIEAIGQDQFETILEEMSEEEALSLLYDWSSWARPQQLAPVWPVGSTREDGTVVRDWTVWLWLAGRGSGKTRTGSEWIKSRVAGKYGSGPLSARGAQYLAFVGQSAGDVRDVMVEGEAGILSVYRKADRPLYEPSKRRIVWPNGAVCSLFSSADPEQLRGPSHDTLWADELAAWENMKETWSNGMFGLRLGESKALVTTTPRPVPVLKDLLKREGSVENNYAGTVHVSRGTTYDNISNLSEVFIEEIIKPYEGTRVGRQELLAELLEDVEGALWTNALIEQQFIHPDEFAKRVAKDHLVRVAVAIDPNAGGGEHNTEAGIMVGGIDRFGNGYLMEDLSEKTSPNVWAKTAVKAYQHHNANCIIAEKNNGGEMVGDTIRSASKEHIPVKLVWASRGKIARAEPVSSLTEQRRIFFVGHFPKLQDELTTFDGTGASPNRLDAFVWLFTHLMVKGNKRRLVFGKGKNRRNANG